MRLLALILIAWLWAVVSVQAHQFDAKHCDDAIDTDQLRECLAENLTKSNSWDINKSTNAEGANFLEARLESHDHIACGEKSGHLELVFICSERAPIVFVTGTCRFADHARFGRFNIKIGEMRRQKFVATALDGGNALGPTDSKDVIRIADAITNAEKVTIQIQPFPWLPTNATFYPTEDGAQIDEIRGACLE
jgi:hypothetical protein